MKVVRVSNPSDLPEQIIGSNWGADNEMDDYDIDSLQSYLDAAHTHLLAAVEAERVTGLLLCSHIPKPYKNSDWLYIDELDTHPDFRRQGVAKMLLDEAFKLAKELKVAEVWLGTELDNAPARKLYESYKPQDIEEFIGYTWEI